MTGATSFICGLLLPPLLPSPAQTLPCAYGPSLGLDTPAGPAICQQDCFLHKRVLTWALGEEGCGEKGMRSRGGGQMSHTLPRLPSWPPPPPSLL